MITFIYLFSVFKYYIYIFKKKERRREIDQFNHFNIATKITENLRKFTVNKIVIIFDIVNNSSNFYKRLQIRYFNCFSSFNIKKIYIKDTSYKKIHGHNLEIPFDTIFVYKTDVKVSNRLY